MGIKTVVRQNKEDVIESHFIVTKEKHDLKSYDYSSLVVPWSSGNEKTFLCSKKYIVEWLKDVFLPRGYPKSVSSDYIQYQMWDSLQAYFSNLTGALSLHSTLVGIGVGEDSASPLAAALSWLLKDGAGMVSSITFAYFKGCELDFNSKQWRLFADVANDLSHCIKLLAPILPFPFLITICISSVMSSLVGVAGGATRASLIQHQALCGNMADVSAKDGSQETMVNLTGLITSLTLLPFLTSSSLITWFTFMMCVSLHLFCNFKAMRSLHMRSLNRPRILHVFDEVTKNALVPGVTSTNEVEPLFLGPAFIKDYLLENFRLEAGVNLSYVCSQFSSSSEFYAQFENQISALPDDKYMMFFEPTSQKVFAVFHQQAESEAYLEAFWCAYLIALNQNKEQKRNISSEYKISADKSIPVSFVTRVKFLAKNTFKDMVAGLHDQGWQTDPLRVNFGDWRITVEESTQNLFSLH